MVSKSLKSLLVAGFSLVMVFFFNISMARAGDEKKDEKKLDPAKWVYIVEAARETGLPRLAIVDLVRRGRIRKIASAGKTFVSRAGIEEFMKRTPEAKRKASKKK